MASWRSMMKIEGSGTASGSRSISQRHGSADPDPHQNVMDPQHCFKLALVTQKQEIGKASCFPDRPTWLLGWRRRPCACAPAQACSSPGSAYTKHKLRTSNNGDLLHQCCGSGSAWIRIGNTDPGARKFTKINKCPAFQQGICTFVGIFYALTYIMYIFIKINKMFIRPQLVCCFHCNSVQLLKNILMKNSFYIISYFFLSHAISCKFSHLKSFRKAVETVC